MKLPLIALFSASILITIFFQLIYDYSHHSKPIRYLLATITILSAILAAGSYQYLLLHWSK